MTDNAETNIPVAEVIVSARDLARAGRWHRAANLLAATRTGDGRSRALLALAAAEVAVERDWVSGTDTAAGHLAAADRICAAVDLDPGSTWDLDFLRLRHQYFGQIIVDGSFRPGPEGKDLAALAEIRGRAERLRDQAPDLARQGWAEMYLGLIADNLYGERAAAPAHYRAALRAAEGVTDDGGTDSDGAGAEGTGAEGTGDLLAREALRHLGDHDHDAGDHRTALDRWERATALAARAGAVPGTLSQVMLLAVLARDTGDETGAVALAREVARWAAALGAVRIEAQATGFLAGADPTGPPENRSLRTASTAPAGRADLSRTSAPAVR